MDKAVPKYWKGKYDVYDFESYKDVPGWVNDAEFIYEEMVNQAEDGDHFVEIGVLLGQSNAIDIFWIIEHTIRNYKLSGHPKEFFHYIDELKTEWDLDIMNMIRHPLKALGVVDYVNFITCEEQYAHSIYKDNSLKFVWIDGDHGADVVYNDLVNFWPKIKVGGTIGGDDIHYEEVLNDVKKFSKKYKVNVKYDYNSFLITKE